MHSPSILSFNNFSLLVEPLNADIPIGCHGDVETVIRIGVVLVHAVEFVARIPGANHTPLHCDALCALAFARTDRDNDRRWGWSCWLMDVLVDVDVVDVVLG